MLGDCACSTRTTPSILALTRQGLPLLRTDAHRTRTSPRKGAYVLIEPKGKRDVTLIATGSEVSLAVTAAKQLAEEGIKAAVVSMPCWELFDAQDRELSRRGAGRAPRVGVEAAVEFGWREMARILAANSSACVDLALLLRPRTFISISESRRTRSRRPPRSDLGEEAQGQEG